MAFLKPKRLLFIYNFCWFLLTPLVPILLIYRILIGKEELSRVKERFGYNSLKIESKKDKLLWLHAASLGEVVSATSLSIGLREIGFKGTILITSGTKTSSFFLKDYKDILHQYHPLDKKVWVDRFIKFWKPDALIMIESEVWPNLIMRAKKMSVPVIMASAQISNKSFKRMTKIGKQSTKFLFDQIDMIFTTDSNQTKKFQQLGSDKVLTSTSLKVSLPPKAPNKVLIQKFEKILKKKTIILAASTREGEEDILIKCVNQLNKDVSNILLIIAPRHIKRAHEISELNRLNIKLKSKGEFPSIEDNFWISDTYGEMQSLYTLAEIIFVGGSLFPFGGHNPSEACHYNSRIIIGPHTEKCQEIVDQMKSFNALVQLKSSSLDELSDTIKKMLISSNFKRDLKNATSLMTNAWKDERTNVALKIINLVNSSK